MDRALTYLDNFGIIGARMPDPAKGGLMIKFCLCAEEIFDELWNGASKFDTIVFYDDDFDHDELYNASKNYPEITFALNKRHFDAQFTNCQNIIYFDSSAVWPGSNRTSP